MPTDLDVRAVIVFGSVARPVSLGRPLLPEADDVSATLATAEGDTRR